MELDFRKDPTILSTVVDTMADGVFTVDAQGRFVAWSAGAERITGYAAADVIGKPCELLEGPNCKGFGKLAEMLAAPSPPAQGICNQECKLAARDGRELYILGNVRVLTEKDGRIAGAVGTFTDLTSFILANQKIAILEEQARSRFAFEQLVGKSEAMKQVFHRIRLAADSDVTVFVSGESGTGKELAARAIHAQSPRRDEPFIAVNCSAIPETLLESELFGHVKGAFTGAVRDKIGMFQAADKGTLFLDEIGDVSPMIQLKMLRVIQEREIRRVGDDRPLPVDVRLITATNRNLKKLVQSGEFREDFYYRIHVFEIPLPPLRERRDDIPLLVDHFIREMAAAQNKPVTGIARDAMQRMMDHDWPGNVRELRNAIEHAFVTVAGEMISLLDLPPEVRTAQSPHTGRQAAAAPPEPRPLTPQQEQERQRIIEALAETGGNRTEAARLLQTSRVTLWKKIRKYAIEG
ncbi:Transcriptional regulatory protein ZraR [Maioricimonas rarisocia]|uniref:Transcriptional regulatory protein ZraR n=1 Tax=Maioricimonas rarisocia TaxID=2528026 RepID=A0A517ZCG8_9PLAN|nr:sigma 54-interacting transcriptional regulator [Maioricimonas rarisocia]QDU40196.1 Transcriptional regulatory protein ZraR [Maioricimonas rarisocia]